MIREGQAGIDCAHCGYLKTAGTAQDASALEKTLEWRFGSPLCPKCRNAIVFENYIGDVVEAHELNGSNPNPPECDPRC